MQGMYKAHALTDRKSAYDDLTTEISLDLD